LDGNIPTTTAGIQVQTTGTIETVNRFGAPVEIAPAVDVDDKIAPVLTKTNKVDNVAAVANTIALTFSEPIDIDTVSNYSFSVEGYNVTGRSVSGNDVVLTVSPKAGSGNPANPVVGTSVTQNQAIFDEKGNSVSSLSTEVKAVRADKTALNAAITAAEAQHTAATEGAGNGQYNAGSKATYLTAINAAKAVAADAAATSAQVATAVTNLANATTAFNGQRVVVNYTNLNTAITAAQAKHDGAVEGSVAGEYGAGSKATFQTAINDAQAVASNTSATQAEVDAALAALQQADTDFEATKVSA
jgi:hypothetical protein